MKNGLKINKAKTITKKTITALFKDKFKIFFNIYQFGFIFFKNNRLNII